MTTDELIRWFDSLAEKYESDLTSWTDYDEQTTKQNLRVLMDKPENTYPERTRHLLGTPGTFQDSSSFVSEVIEKNNESYQDKILSEVNSVTSLNELEDIDIDELNEYQSDTQSIIASAIESRRAELEEVKVEPADEIDITLDLVGRSTGLSSRQIEKEIESLSPEGQSLIREYLSQREDEYYRMLNDIKDAKTIQELDMLDSIKDVELLGPILSKSVSRAILQFKEDIEE